MTQTLKEAWLSAPDSQLDHNLLPLIEKWDEPNPTAIQVLELLDQVVHTGGGSEFVVVALKSMLNSAITSESTTYEAVVANAHWRKEPNGS